MIPVVDTKKPEKYKKSTDGTEKEGKKEKISLQPQGSNQQKKKKEQTQRDHIQRLTKKVFFQITKAKPSHLKKAKETNTVFPKMPMILVRTAFISTTLRRTR
jgi:hypothetical protein